MTAPTNAAKAASILHHVSGVGNAASAYTLYDKLSECETADQMADVLEAVDCCMWSAIDHLPYNECWENVENLAICIDACREKLS